MPRMDQPTEERAQRIMQKRANVVVTGLQWLITKRRMAEGGFIQKLAELLLADKEERH
jgi:hypothetical protein